MRTIAYYALHYGKEYLAWSVRSIEDAVDEIHLLYTDVPSHGPSTGALCPDTEEELKREARRFCRKPTFWHRGRWSSEEEQRKAILPIAQERGARRMLMVDADEIWAPGLAAAALEASARYGRGRIRVSFIHFWRSFKWACSDPTKFYRVFNLLPGGGFAPGEWSLPPQAIPVLHFGYAQSPETTRYKWTCHGHQHELRPGWLKEKFMGWKPGDFDVHPVRGHGFWNPQPTPPGIAETLRSVLWDHPWLEHDVIPEVMRTAH